MGKLTSVNGKATGKIGSIVYSVSGGQQIAREYQPVVANPNTPQQVENRSRLKLLSQLSAAYKSSIAIRKQGMTSARNQFIGVNYQQTAIQGETVDINLSLVQLTKSNVGMIGFSADRSSGTKINVELNENGAAQFDKVVYCAFRKNAAGHLLAAGSVVVETAGVGGSFKGELPYTADAVVVYAYGMKIAEGKAATAYANMSAPSAENVAKLYTTSAEVAAGTTLSQTVGLTMMVGETTGDSDDVEHLSVSVIKSGNGSVAGGGRYVAGQQVTVTATPDAEASFVAWKLNNASGQTVSTSASYTFEATSDITLCAVFQGGPVVKHTIAVSASPVEGGTVSGGGQKDEGSQCTVNAVPASGFQFDGWFENGQLVSNNANYKFTVSADRTLVAEFAEQQESSFSNVMIGSTAWNQNGQALANDHVTGSYSGEGSHVYLTSSQPSVGGSISTSGATRINSGAFNMFPPGEAGTYWLVAGNYDEENETFYTKAIFQYTCTKS